MERTIENGFLDLLGRKKGRGVFSDELIGFIESEMNLDNRSSIMVMYSDKGKLLSLLRDLPHNSIYAVDYDRQRLMDVLTKYRDYIDVIPTLIDSSNLERIQDNTADLLAFDGSMHNYNILKLVPDCRRILKQQGKIAIFCNYREPEFEFAKETAALAKRLCLGFKSYTEDFDIIQNSIKEIFENFKVFSVDFSMQHHRDSWIYETIESVFKLKDYHAGYNEAVEGLGKIFDKYAVNGNLYEPIKSVVFIGTVKGN